MKKQLKRSLSIVDISCFDTCIGWTAPDFYDDYYKYFDSEDDIERRGSLLCFAWMLHGAWYGCEYPFNDAVYTYHNGRKNHKGGKEHYIEKYVGKFLECKNEIQRDFPKTFEAITLLVPSIVAKRNYSTKAHYFSAETEERLMKLDGYREVFCTNDEEARASGYYGIIRRELDVDMMIEKLGVKVITFDTTSEEYEKIMNEYS